ncbi:hybrid signal transduction histidine kinase L [Condylostylus longicornis]|uniref:hybrid signal transduction histidine kinase L n=1 Tax=Condylostylus longicornis TaxID=2530218 RepID=UPI00244E2CD8|nr:hybrid signal transduction histidine kinase L [Condylostylus longicornis]
MSSALAVPTLTITSVTGADGHQLPPGTTLSSIPSSSSSSTTLNNNSNNNTSNNGNNSNGNSTTSIGNINNGNSSSNTTIKQERHDEAEIAEMAAKMLEQQRLALAKQVAQQQQIVNRQQMATAALSSSQHIPGLPGNQTNILNYLTRKPPNSQLQNGNIPFNISGTPTTPNISGLGSSQQNGATSSSTVAASAASNGSKSSTVSSTENSGNVNSTNSSSASPDPDKKVCNDEESQKGHFGWATFGKIYIPYVTRSGEKYCAVRMVEMKLLNKYLSYLHPDIYSSCTYVRSYFITEAESRLLNEINHKHCDAQFGRDLFTLKDLVVRLSDATKFYQFLDICYRKLLSGSKSPSDRCGFIRINKESVVPYTVRNNEQVVPLFYFEGETDNLRQKADCLSGWDLAYLKFCCKVQGIRNELFSSESVAVISLKDIKSYFPNGTEFEDYWPSKVVDSNLLIASKNPGNSVNWTRQPSGPPPKITQPSVIPNLAKQQQAQNANNIANQLRNKAYQNAAALQNPNSVATQQRLNTAFAAQQTAAAAVQALTNGWGLNPALLSQVSQAQTAQLLAAQAQQQQNQRGYAAGRNQTMQNLLSNRQQYNYANGLQMTGMQHPQQQQPPPLVRSQSQSHMLNSTASTSMATLQRSLSATTNTINQIPNENNPSLTTPFNNISENNSLPTINQNPALISPPITPQLQKHHYAYNNITVNGINNYNNDDINNKNSRNILNKNKIDNIPSLLPVRRQNNQNYVLNYNSSGNSRSSSASSSTSSVSNGDINSINNSFHNNDSNYNNFNKNYNNNGNNNYNYYSNKCINNNNDNNNNNNSNKNSNNNGNVDHLLQNSHLDELVRKVLLNPAMSTYITQNISSHNSNKVVPKPPQINTNNQSHSFPNKSSGNQGLYFQNPEISISLANPNNSKVSQSQINPVSQTRQKSVICSTNSSTSKDLLSPASQLSLLQLSTNTSTSLLNGTMEVTDLSPPSRRSLNPATANQLQAQQQQQQQRQQQQQQQTYNQLQMQVRQNAMAAANTVALQQQLLAQQQQQRASAAVNAMTTDPHNQMLRIIPEIPSNTQSPPYKVQKVLVFDNTMISCINMKAYNDTDQLMTLADFREHFFPNVQLDHCKRLIEALGVEMYKGNRRQIQTLIENGKPHSENIPLILVRDVIKYMPQLRYMMRSQEQPPQKRSRIS